MNLNLKKYNVYKCNFVVDSCQFRYINHYFRSQLDNQMSPLIYRKIRQPQQLVV